MIINKFSKEWQTRSDMPNSNWLDNDWVVVPDGSELSQKAEKFFPRFDIVFDENENVIDIVEVPKTQEELNAERVQEIKAELKDLDTTINRATEDLYTLTNTTPYESVKEVIDRKVELRNELKKY